MSLLRDRWRAAIRIGERLGLYSADVASGAAGRLDASAEERARRRIVEVHTRDPSLDPERIRRTQAERDEKDTGRAVAPLRRAPEAVFIDSTGLPPAEVLARVLEQVHSRVPPDA